MVTAHLKCLGPCSLYSMQALQRAICCQVLKRWQLLEPRNSETLRQSSAVSLTGVKRQGTGLLKCFILVMFYYLSLFFFALSLGFAVLLHPLEIWTSFVLKLTHFPLTSPDFYRWLLLASLATIIFSAAYLGRSFQLIKIKQDFKTADLYLLLAYLALTGCCVFFVLLQVSAQAQSIRNEMEQWQVYLRGDKQTLLGLQNTSEELVAFIRQFFKTNFQQPPPGVLGLLDEISYCSRRPMAHEPSFKLAFQVPDLNLLTSFKMWLLVLLAITLATFCFSSVCKLLSKVNRYLWVVFRLAFLSICVFNFYACSLSAAILTLSQSKAFQHPFDFLNLQLSCTRSAKGRFARMRPEGSLTVQALQQTVRLMQMPFSIQEQVLLGQNKCGTVVLGQYQCPLNLQCEHLRNYNCKDAILQQKLHEQSKLWMVKGKVEQLMAVVAKRQTLQFQLQQGKLKSCDDSLKLQLGRIKLGLRLIAGVSIAFLLLGLGLVKKNDGWQVINQNEGQ